MLNQNKLASSATRRKSLIHMGKISIEFFGVLVEVTGNKSITIEGITDTESLKAEINKLFPEMKEQTYMLAVNNKLVKNNTSILNDCKVACMPPFAGG